MVKNPLSFDSGFFFVIVLFIFAALDKNESYFAVLLKCDYFKLIDY